MSLMTEIPLKNVLTTTTRFYSFPWPCRFAAGKKLNCALESLKTTDSKSHSAINILWEQKDWYLSPREWLRNKNCGGCPQRKVESRKRGHESSRCTAFSFLDVMSDSGRKHAEKIEGPKDPPFFTTVCLDGKQSPLIWCVFSSLYLVLSTLKQWLR